jgi:ABC-type sugar transport system substrate-binding protein
MRIACQGRFFHRGAAFRGVAPVFPAKFHRGDASASPDAKYKIGVLYWSMNIPGQVAMRAGLEAEARRLDEDASKRGARAWSSSPKSPATAKRG